MVDIVFLASNSGINMFYEQPARLVNKYMSI